MKVGVVHRWWYLDHARPSARQQKKAYQRDERAPSAAYHRSGSEERRASEGRRAHRIHMVAFQLVASLPAV